MSENHFRYLIQGSKEAEKKLTAGDLEGLRAEEKRVSTIILDFSRDWKKSLDSGKSCPHSQNKSLHLLQQYYHRFSKVLGVAPISQIADTA